jgi:hypothetical protein
LYQTISNTMLTLFFLSISFFITQAWPIDVQRSVVKRRLRELQTSSSNPFSPAITKLTASDGDSLDYFGHGNQVAISENRIVVGALNAGFSAQGAVYLFMDPNDPVSGRQYSEIAILQARDRSSGAWFGDSVDIDGDRIIVGATGDFNQTGAVYVFQILNDTSSTSTVKFTQLAKITAENGIGGSQFGISVAIDQNLILVGAIDMYDDRIAVGPGSAYLFAKLSSDRNGQEWTQVIQFQPNNLYDGDQFGESVALDGTTAVVGTWHGNVAYVYEKVNNDNDASSWTELTKLSGTSSDYFGDPVALAGDWMVVGDSEYVNGNGIFSGAAFVYYKSNETNAWSQVALLIAADGADFDQFGFSLAMSRDASTIVVGALSDDFGASTTDSGSAYLFRSDSTTAGGWTQVGKFVAPDGATKDYLSQSIAIDGDIVIIGAPFDDIASLTDVGSVYVLDVDTGFSTVIPTPLPTANPTNAPTSPQHSTPEPTTNPSKNPPNAPTFPPSFDSKDPVNSTEAESANDSSDNKTHGLSSGAIIGLVLIVVVGMVVALVAYFNYRVKFQTVIQEKHPEPTTDPTMFSGNSSAAVPDEAQLMAEVMILPAPVPVECPLEAMVIADEATSSHQDQNAVGKRPPRYKDQIRTFIESGTSLDPFEESTGTLQGIPRSKNAARYPDNDHEEEKQEEQRHRDPPASTTWQQNDLPNLYEF